MRPTNPLILFVILTAGGCQSAQEKTLRHHIDVIGQRVAVVEQAIEAKTPAISSATHGIATQVRFRPLLAWTERYNQRPPGEKTIRFRQTRRHGQIAEWSRDCWLAGSRSWYVEIDSSTATKADLLINNLNLYYEANAITLGAGFALDAETRLHWHIDATCIGGGFGDRENVDADARGPAYFRLALLPMNGDDLPYRISLAPPTAIEGSVRVDLGVFGVKRFPFKFNAAGEVLSEGTLSLLVDQSGELGPLPNGQAFTYRVRTSNPVARIDGAGLGLTADLEMVVDPALREALVTAAAASD